MPLKRSCSGHEEKHEGTPKGQQSQEIDSQDERGQAAIANQPQHEDEGDIHVQREEEFLIAANRRENGGD